MIRSCSVVESGLLYGRSSQRKPSNRPLARAWFPTSPFLISKTASFAQKLSDLAIWGSTEPQSRSVDSSETPRLRRQKSPSLKDLGPPFAAGFESSVYSRASLLADRSYISAERAYLCWKFFISGRCPKSQTCFLHKTVHFIELFGTLFFQFRPRAFDIASKNNWERVLRRTHTDRA